MKIHTQNMHAWLKNMIIILFLLVLPIATYAQIDNPLNCGGTGTDRGCSVTRLIALALEKLIYYGGMVAVFMFVWSGFLFVQARGNPAGIEKAKKFLLGVVIGFAILLGAELIKVVIENTIKALSA